MTRDLLLLKSVRNVLWCLANGREPWERYETVVLLVNVEKKITELIILKTLRKIHLVIASLVTLAVLNQFIADDWAEVLVLIILGGGLTLVLDRFFNSQYSDSFNYMKQLVDYAHPKAKSFWKFGKSFAAIFLIKIVNIDWLQSILDNVDTQSDSHMLLFKSALTVLVISGSAMIISANLRLNDNETSRVKAVKIDHWVKLKIVIPHGFIKSKGVKMKNVVSYVNPISNAAIDIEGENIKSFDEDITEAKYLEQRLSIIKESDDIKLGNIIKKSANVCEVCLSHHKRKFIVLTMSTKYKSRLVFIMYSVPFLEFKLNRNHHEKNFEALMTEMN